MNEAKALLDAGKLDEAISSAIAHVKSKPADVASRIFLFELMLFAGEFDRAEKQIDVVSNQDFNAAIGILIYKQCLKCERDRLRYFGESLMPNFVGEIPEYVHLLGEANKRIREGNIAEAREALDKSEELRPAISGKINGVEFEDFRDYNDLTSSILEVFIKDSYMWIPFSQIKRIEIIKPLKLRELFWTQAKVEMLNGIEGEMMIPAVYSNSWKSQDNQVRLARATDWRDLGDDVYIGEGQRLFWIDGKDKAFLEIETIEFNNESA